MSYRVNKFELAAVSKLSGPDRYSYFVRKVADWGEIWSIGDDEGWRLIGDDEGTELIPIWPAEAFAKEYCQGPRLDCKPRPIALDLFLHRWISGMSQDGRKAAVFPLTDGLAVRVDPERLAFDIQEVLDSLIDPS